MSISWSWETEKSLEFYGDQAKETDLDFDSKSKAEKFANQYFENYHCPNCGFHQVDGANIKVEISYVKLFKYETKKGFFGGTKTVTKHWKSVHRVGRMIFIKGGFFGGTGYLKCPKCDWRQEGDSFWKEIRLDAARMEEEKRKRYG
jgi:ribosomal protein L37AE/L43A